METIVDDFFEGAEKRLVIKFNVDDNNYYQTDIWENILQDINCHPLGIIKNEHQIMFLLAESVLVVTHHHVILKTCGKTTPLNLVGYLSEKNINISDVEYSHPNFIRPMEQPLLYHSFENQIKFINSIINQNFNFLMKAHMNYYFTNKITDNLEIILWDFTWDANIIRQFKNLLKGWVIDDFKFEPDGHSINSFMDDKYITIHVTPNKSCSYLSIECNDPNYFFDIIPLFLKLSPQKIGFFTNRYDKDVEYHLSFINNDNLTNSDSYIEDHIYVKHYF